MTQPHRFLPVPLAIDEPERPPIWSCAGCGLTRQDPSPKLGDECKAGAMELGDET